MRGNGQVAEQAAVGRVCRMVESYVKLGYVVESGQRSEWMTALQTLVLTKRATTSSQVCARVLDVCCICKVSIAALCLLLGLRSPGKAASCRDSLGQEGSADHIQGTHATLLVTWNAGA